MNLDISAHASLRGQLLDSVTGLAQLASLGLNFGSRSTLPDCGIVSVSWTPVTGKVLTIDLESGFDITADSVFGPSIEVIQHFSGDDAAWVQDADSFEVVLAADPLALDVYGNPVAASRASELTVTAYNASDVSQGASVLAVTAPGQAAILRRVGKMTGSTNITKLAVTAVTATPCKLYILLGGGSAT